MSAPLFRPEAVHAKRTRLHGDLVLSAPLEGKLLTAAALVALAAVVLFLALGSYARKERVAGFVVPEAGVAKIYPPTQGVFRTVEVREGQRVEAGERLFTTYTPADLAGGGDAEDETLEILAEHRERLERTVSAEGERRSIEQRALEDRIAQANGERAALRRQRRLLRERLALVDDHLDRATKLHARELLSDTELAAQQQKSLALHEEDASLERQIAVQAGLVSDFETRLALIDPSYQRTLLDLSEKIDAVRQRELDVRRRAGVEVRAPISGTVTSVHASLGLEAAPAKPALSILPAESRFQVTLLVPTRAIGFVEPGQKVRIRYQAFPYQQFGTYGGSVTEVGRALLSPEEIGGGARPDEPVYRVKVGLEDMEVHAYGNAYPLQSGMMLEADIMLAPRSLIDWLLEPVYTLRGRLS